MKTATELVLADYNLHGDGRVSEEELLYLCREVMPDVEAGSLAALLTSWGHHGEERVDIAEFFARLAC